MYEDAKNAELSVIRVKFERIATKINLLWGTPEAEKYFTELLITDRPESRQGFPFDVLSAILTLSNIHSMEFGNNLRSVFGKTTRAEKSAWENSVLTR